MILIHQISNLDLEYINDIKEYLKYNVLNPIIEKIVIFSNCKGFEDKIKIESKKIKYFEVEINIFDMMKYGKNNTRNFVIYSTPFIRFNVDLKKVLTFDKANVFKEENCYYIFDRKMDIKNDRNIEDILLGKKVDLKLNIQKNGYYINGFQYKSYDWRVSKTFDIASKKNIEVIKEKIDDVKEPKILTEAQVLNFLKTDKMKKLENSVSEKNINSNKKVLDIKRVGPKKLDVIIVSVNYNDFLIVSLENNIRFFDRITVVTSSSDFLCQKICKKFGVNCVVTDNMYENGAVFNKGKAINKGIKSISNPDYILLLDADILVVENIDIDALDEKTLYTSDRYFIPDYKSYKGYISGKIEKDNFILERDQGFGFFQLFNYSKCKTFPESSEDASTSDILFRDKFYLKKGIDNKVFHIGDDSNWKGRKSKSFLDYDVFNQLFEKKNFDINFYFDKIYCINLDRRTDRWKNVESEFKKMNIDVFRYSAIDGDNIDFSISNDLTENQLSDKGLIENRNSLACLLSHLEIIKEAKLNNYKRILIFEDDVLFSKDFKNEIKKIEELDWKLLYLGASQFNWSGIDTSKKYYRCNKTLGTFAYAIDSSIYDELIILLSSKVKSVDNYFSDFQIGRKDCYVLYPNIVVSIVSDSDIRNTKNISEYSNTVKWNLSNFGNFKKEKIKKVLLVPDVKGWAFDNIANSIVKYNPYPDKIYYETVYISEMMAGKKININLYDYVYIFFEAERIIPDNPKVIRGCYSAFWLERENITPKLLGSYFSKCKASIFANDYLRDSISPYLPDGYPTTIIHDSADENVFYPIKNRKKNRFTVIFVGNVKRKVKRFDDIVDICKKADVDLIVCSDIKNDDLVNYYNKADVCINFSDFEGGPQTFLESSLCEVPMLIRSNNELAKLIPCFTGDTKEEFVDILQRLKKNRSECSSLGKKAKEVVLKKFTYSKTSKKFADFFLNIDDYMFSKKRDLTKSLTVFIIRSGKNPNYEDCLYSLNNQTTSFKLKEIRDIAPMSKAFQKMIDDCDTEYYIQVDEDMILDIDAIESIYDEIISSEDKVAIVAHMLIDVHLDFDIYGVKGYKHEILKNYPYNLEIISCEVDQMNRMKADGYDTLMIGYTIGKHSPKWTPGLIYERYFDLMEKWKKYKYHWMEEIPAKLLKIFQEDSSDINLYALMGAMSSISTEEPIRKREKNFKLKDENFEKIKLMIEKSEFLHIKNNS